MMKNNLVAKASVSISASTEMIWDALVDPGKIEKYMFGTRVESDMKEGSPILWKGTWDGKPYVDKGRVLQSDPGKLLKYSHFSTSTGQADNPENYHTVTVVLSEKPGEVVVNLSQDHNPTDEARQHSEENWNMMLKALKDFVEKENGS